MRRAPLTLLLAVCLAAGFAVAIASARIPERGNKGHHGNPHTTTTSTSPTTTVVTTTAPTTTIVTTTAPTTTVTTTNPVTTTAPVTTTSPGGTYLFDDEFSGDLSKWEVGWFGGAGPVNSAEAAAYSPSHVWISGGNLHMTLTADSIYAPRFGHNVPYTGALVSTEKSGLFHVSPPYRVEARMYLPASGSRAANWPGFWDNGNSWPTDGENDTMEVLGGDACFHYHSPSGGPGGCASGNFSGWHTFAAVVVAGSATYYYDGAKVGTITQGINATAPHYLILQQTISDHHPETAIAPAEVLVDYVRVSRP